MSKHEGGGLGRVTQVGTDMAIAAGAALATGGGSLGAGVGAATVLGGSFGDFLSRQLSSRQRSRIERLETLARQRLARALSSEGQQIRSDGFFAEQPGGRNAGDEAIEGVLAVARDAYEERKLPHLAQLMTHIAVCDWISPEFANYLIRLAESLSWNQYVLICAIGQRESLHIPDVEINRPEKSWSSWAVSSELYDLWEVRRLIHGGYETHHGMQIPSRKLRSQSLQDGGKAIFNALGLAEVGALSIAHTWQLLLQDDSIKYP